MPPSRTVPFMDMKARLRSTQEAIEAAVQSVLRSGQFIGGEWRTRCENELSTIVDMPYAVGVSSGTSALKMALQAMGVQAGDEVIVPAVSFVATYEAVAQTGATPVVVDVQAGSALICNASIEAAITNRTRAIVPVHLFGHFANVDDFGISVVDDSAQALGSQRISHGQMAALSFYPTKIIGGVGDGGMVFCQSQEAANRVRALGHHGICNGQQQGEVDNHMPGNDRLDAIQAAAILAQLPELNHRIECRQKIAAAYDSVLGEWVLPRDTGSNISVYAFCHPKRDQLRQLLAERGVSTAIYYDTPLSQHSLARQSQICPNASHFCQQVLSLPCHGGLADDDIEYICQVLRAVRRLL